MTYKYSTTSSSELGVTIYPYRRRSEELVRTGELSSTAIQEPSAGSALIAGFTTSAKYTPEVVSVKFSVRAARRRVENTDLNRMLARGRKE
jgi:hypothetical protein